MIYLVLMIIELSFFLQMKDKKMFDEWLNVFKYYRLYRQYEIVYGIKEFFKLIEIIFFVEDFNRFFFLGI